jgi:hypothetical protein
MRDSQPYCDYPLTVRVEIPHRPGQFARLAIAQAKLVAARAIAAIIPEDHLSEDDIVPSVFDKPGFRAVTRVVAGPRMRVGWPDVRSGRQRELESVNRFER